MNPEERRTGRGRGREDKGVIGGSKNRGRRKGGSERNAKGALTEHRGKSKERK